MNYDLTQTGPEVQGILDKGNALPANPDQVIAAKIDTAVSLTYTQLKTLRDGGQLKAGQMYRITDFVTTTAQAETQSAGHQFDVIVCAGSPSTLLETAYAARHDGDTYFQNCKLEAWRLKYCLDNDTNRFAWGDATNGKGVIYFMQDEFGNRCPYDFKNIMFARYQITACQKVPDLVNQYLGFADIQSPNTKYPQEATISNTAVYRYTFDYLQGTTSRDLTVYQLTQTAYRCYDNEVDMWIVDGQKKRQLNNITIGGTQYANTYGNHFSTANRNMAFNHSCYGNTFGTANYNMSFGNGNGSCSFGNSNYNMSFGNYNYGCSFGNNNYRMSFGNGNNNMSFGNNNYGCSFGNNNYGCSFGNYNQYCSFGNWNNNMSFGNNNGYCSFGNYNQYNSFGNENYNCSFGNSNYNMSFGNYNRYCSFGDGISGVAIGNGEIGLTFTLGLDTFDYGYDSWDEYEDEDSGDTYIQGVSGVYLNLQYTEAQQVSGHVTILAKHGSDTTTLYDGDITTDSDGYWEATDLEGSWEGVPADDCYIFYKAEWQDNGYRASRTDYESW